MPIQALLLLFKSNFWHQSPTYILHRVSNKCLQGTVFRHICISIVWISPFEEKGNAKWWKTCAKVQGVICHTRSVCPHIGLGGFEGLQGSFSIKDLIHFSLLSHPPLELLTNFKGVGGNLTGIYFWAFHPLKCWFSTSYKTHSQIFWFKISEIKEKSVCDKQNVHYHLL